MNAKIFAAAAFAAASLSQPSHATAVNLITNGNFTQSTYTTNNEFGTPYGGQGVTGWTGGSGYELYFFAATASTNSANSEFDSGYNTGSEKFYTMATPPVSGNFVALDGGPTTGSAGSISQILSNLTVGTNYLVSFYWAAGQLQSKSGATTEDLIVTLGNQSQTTQVVNNASQSSTPWLQQSFIFQATSTTETLTFLAQGTPIGLPPIVALDGVSMVDVPEPMSIAVFCMGLGLLTLVQKRRW
jgi:hypothetical protein